MEQHKAPHGKVIGVAKTFRTGGSRAVRLPAAEAAGVDEWVIEKLDDGRLILEPRRVKKSAAALLAQFATLEADLYPEGREPLDMPERGW